MRLKKHAHSAAAMAAAFLLSVALLPAEEEGGASHGQVASAVARLLEQGHFTRQKLDPRISGEFLENYLNSLDYNRLYFLQSDIEEFRGKYADSLHESLVRGDIEPAFEIFERYRDRVEDRVAKNLELIQEGEFTFDSDRTVEINREDAEWPADMAAADGLWRNRIEAELLQENLNESRIDEPGVVVEKRYDQVLQYVGEQEDEDIVKGYLSALAQTYDPHSDYLSPADMENFAISMRLSLVGVGAVLRQDEGYARVVEVVPGGPADRDGRLRVNDRIAAVAQGENEFEDVVGMKLDKVVERIRGKKGTIVRLLVVPGDAVDPAERAEIDITRDEVELKDQAARAEIIDFPAEGDFRDTRIGWITLPSFYADMSRGGAGGARSTTDDVTRLLNRLNEEKIEGLVIDLRRDGGGSLDEAIKLTGLFIPGGPVVQSKDNNGRIIDNRDDDGGRVLYDGPLVVLMNRLSASASEIFAAALQDYGRAVIVGDERSFGKGTVQQVIDVGRFMPFFSLAASDAGSLKLTVAKFYRVSGGSTQLNGVESDIVLPSAFDNPEIGESALNNPLPYDEVPARSFERFAGSSLFLNELRRRSTERVANEPEFQYTLEDISRMKQRIERNALSLNIEKRDAEVEAEKQRKEQRDAARRERGPALDATAYEVTLENVDADGLEKIAFDRENPKRSLLDIEAAEDIEATDSAATDAEDPIVKPDPIRNEALHIVQDMIELQSAGKTAQAETN